MGDEADVPNGTEGKGRGWQALSMALCRQGVEEGVRGGIVGLPRPAV